MKKVNRYVPDVSQTVGDRGTEVVERVLTAYGVARAEDLPEEGRVRLHRELTLFFENEISGGLEPLRRSDVGWRGAWKRAWSRLWLRLRRR